MSFPFLHSFSSLYFSIISVNLRLSYMYVQLYQLVWSGLEQFSDYPRPVRTALAFNLGGRPGSAKTFET